MPRMSVATIDSPEFINITNISPLISRCEVKVLYVGENRNRSFITKEVAAEMAQSLPGCPIVGYYIDKKEDFGDHGEQMIVDSEGVKFNTLTTPYGFVAPDAKIWFQKFEDTDDFGNSCVREYLMTEGYLWTTQFEECQRVLENGNPQSMELDEKTLKGHWSTDSNRGVDFFIINDAIFSKLCILGEDVEPCFEGANITAPASSQFSKDSKFTTTLYNMMAELKFALNEKGGNTMENENTIIDPVIAEPAIVEENFSENSDKVNEDVTSENQSITEEFSKKEKEEDKEKDKPSEEPEKDDDEDKKDVTKNTCQEDEEKEDDKKNYELLQANYQALELEHEALKTTYSALEEKVLALTNFKASVEDKEKDELIGSFYMLSEEDKQDVMENKSKYSLEDIEAKLSVICVRKKVNFDLDTNKHEEVQSPSTTFNLDSIVEDASVPAWIKAVESTKNRINK